MTRCAFDFHGECEPCVLDVGHAGLHLCKHEAERREEVGNPLADVEIGRRER